MENITGKNFLTFRRNILAALKKHKSDATPSNADSFMRYCSDNEYTALTAEGYFLRTTFFVQGFADHLRDWQKWEEAQNGRP